MENIIKNYQLKNLNCAHCAGKIDEAIGKIDGVNNHHLNFVKKNLKIEIKKSQADETIRNVLDKIVEIEDVVKVEEIKVDSESKKFKLNNLFCASCAAKIEEAILNLEEVNEGTYNFSTQILKVSLTKDTNIPEFQGKIQKLIDEIEAGVKVTYISSREKKSNNASEDLMSKKEFIQNVVGFFIFIAALFLNEFPALKVSLLITSYILVGGDIILRAFRNLRKKNVFDENFLMTIATFGAFAIGEYPEAAAVMIFYKIGEYFQSKAVGKSRKSIENLMDIRPDYANLLANGKSERVDPEDVSINDIIIVNPGERVPLDGTIVKGSSTLDTSALTGESLPRKAGIGTKVFSGAINKNGSLEIKVSKTFYDSTASKILQLVEDASANKAETERFITKFSKYYTPIVVAIALSVAVIPPLFLGDFSSWLYRALIFLVISCPCALVVSVPLGFFGGIGNSSKKGVLVKGSNFLEALNKVESVIFDKTGTLTEGVFKVVSVENISGSEEEIIELAAHAELNSIHPIAASIKSHYGKDLDRERIADYQELEGLGIKVKVDNDEILLGNHKLLEKKNIPFKESSEFGTIVYLVRNNIHIGNIVIRDEIKVHSKEAVKDLKEQGKKVYMLTGDNKNVADIIAKELGIENVYSNLLPHEKVGKFDEIKGRSNGLVAFVGDGINDAPVLAKADIGISMGGLGSDAAIEASDIVLMEDNPHKISTVIDVAKRTRTIVMQNIFFALGIKVLVMSLGVLGEATMWEAIFADVGVALLAVLNSTRTLR